jgi:pyruvate/2-oxoglutarate dehydrogenase complex dihydrolipoamide dehydrogenase (E3) component
MRSHDAIIIGTGQAGPPLAARLAGAGLETAIVERKLVGGTCVNVGCIPTKALVASARAAHVARRAADFGVELAGDVRVDMQRVHARMKRISGASNAGVIKWLEGLENVELLRGHAQLTGPRTLTIDGEEHGAERIFLNVGCRARVPDLAGIDEVPYLTNSSMLELDELPEHLVIVGASYIGLEFAQMFRRFGSRLTVIERGARAIARDDEDVSDCVREVLEREGVRFLFGADCVDIAPAEGGVRMGVECAEGGPDVVGSHVLLAVGRVPNTDDLGLDAAGVETDEHGYVKVDEELRTSAPGIWALGDCNGQGAFTHTSYNDHEIVAANLFDDDPRRSTDRIPCYGLFVDPPLGRVGMTEDEARRSGRNVLIGKRPMSKVARAQERSETDGFIKLLVDADSEQFLGAAILGIGGDEVVHAIVDLMYARAPYTVMARAVHIHPTVAELLPTTLQDLRPLD